MSVFYKIPTKPIGHSENAIVLNVFPPQDLKRIAWYHRARRLVEFVLCLPLGLAFLALIPLIWLINQVLSPGPLFYSQRRVGIGGRPFSILKFRSMVVDAEKTGAVWASEEDSRVTLVGSFMRRLHLDELPQVWNVLKGEMSLIGPRPERPEFVAALEKELPHYGIRHRIRPGLTGWAQVNYQYGASIWDARIKLGYDLYYVKHQSGRLDLLILIKTISTVLRFNGR